MAESWGPGSALRPAAPPGVRLPQGGLRAPGAGINKEEMMVFHEINLMVSGSKYLGELTIEVF